MPHAWLFCYSPLSNNSIPMDFCIWMALIRLHYAVTWQPQCIVMHCIAFHPDGITLIENFQYISNRMHTNRNRCRFPDVGMRSMYDDRGSFNVSIYWLNKCLWREWANIQLTAHFRYVLHQDDRLRSLNFITGSFDFQMWRLLSIQRGVLRAECARFHRAFFYFSCHLSGRKTLFLFHLR